MKTALAAADPAVAIRTHVRLSAGALIAGRRRYDLTRFENIYVVGAGKAAGPMARAIEQLLGRRITAGSLNLKDGHAMKLRRIEQVECSHPVPDERGLRGASLIAEIASRAGAGDLVLILISGGASALLPLPAPPITLAEKQQTTQLLLASGADIHEINAVRKHISAIKGGQLARMAAPAAVLCLLLSDVIGDDLETIGSGPAAPDPSTFGDARAVLEKFRIWTRVPSAIKDRIAEGESGGLDETPKPGDPLFTRVQNLIVGSNALALQAAARKARELGFRTLLLTSYLEGESKDAGRFHAAIARQIRFDGKPVRPPACVVSGGETTVTLRGEGKGGRNQEFALAAALDLAGMTNVAILSAGTDGTDGPTDAAGGLVDGGTLARAQRAGLSASDHLLRNDSYPLLAAARDLILTGPTGTNVMDLHLILVG